MAIRVTRATKAVPPRPMVTTGRTRAFQLRAPETGNQPSSTEKTRISSRPSQKLGKVEPTRIPAMTP